MSEKPCTILIAAKNDPPQTQALKKLLESKDIQDKRRAMKQILVAMQQGENLNSVLMHVIRFAMPAQDHEIKKLLLIYWEMFEKRNDQGKLLPEMILVVNNIRNDLIHPNEYIRGATLRFLTKLKEADILEPLLPSVTAALKDKHAYVRRLAVLALYNIYKNFEHLAPDAPDQIYSFLMNEADVSAKRNAFMMLVNCAQPKAVEYLNSVIDSVPSMPEPLQLIVIDLIRKVCKQAVKERARYLACLFTLLQASSGAVQYEAAGSLISLSSVPSAVKQSASAYIELLVKESDNNVKLIVLERLLTIKNKYPKILQEIIMDLLRALASPSLDIRKKTLDIALDLVSPKNIDEVVLLLKKEITKTQSKEFEKSGEYRQLLIQTLHQCAVKFPEIAANVVYVLMDFLGDTTSGSAVDVIMFVREVVELYPNVRLGIVKKLIEGFYDIKASKALRGALYILSEYSDTTDEIEAAFKVIKQNLGESLVPDEDEEKEKAEKEKELAKQNQAASTMPKQETPPLAAKPKSGPKLNIDGTYASQSAVTETVKTVSQSSSSTQKKVTLPMRELLLGGDFFLAAVLSTTLTKLAMKTWNHSSIQQTTKNLITVDVLSILADLLMLGQTESAQRSFDPDSLDRIATNIRMLCDHDESVKKVVLESRKSLQTLLKEQEESKPIVKQVKEVLSQVDDVLKVRQLKKGKTLGPEEDFDVDMDVTKATGGEEKKQEVGRSLNRVHQLTGFSDPLYAEAFVTVHHYDIMLEVFVVNQTPETLQNVTLELSTLGDLKLVERPQNYTIAPHSNTFIKASIKVSSTETGVIFGNIVYDVAGQAASDKNNVVLNDIHIDIMDYISPASCTELQFRAMWAEFEWENKVLVNTNISDLNEFLGHIIKSTNMKCLTPESALAGDCGFLSANMYARSVFGEDALANISLEKQPDGKLGGFIRIRSKSQGIALSLGDKITQKQRLLAKPTATTEQ